MFSRMVLMATLISLPWYFGGVTARGHFVLAVGVAASLMAGLVRALWRWSPTITLHYGMTGVLLGAVLLGAVQLIPLGSLQPWLAAATFRWRAEMQPQLDIVAGELQSQSAAHTITTRSIYPAATRRCLGLLVVVVTACILAMSAFRSERAGLALLIAGLATGAAISMLGIVQWLQGADKLYGVVGLEEGGSLFGPYVNRNNAGGFLNLCMACGVGLVAWLHGSSLPQVGLGLDASQGGTRTGSRIGNTVSRGSSALADLSARHLLIWAAVALTGAGVLATISRGSVLAFLAACIVTFLLVRPWARGGWPVWVLVALATIAVVLVAWLGPLQQVRQRFDEALVAESEHPLRDDWRVANWREALKVWPEFAIWGSGLETFSYSHLRYQQRYAGTKIHYHAENQFVQALTDAGVLGLGLLIAAIGIVAQCIRQLARSGTRTGVSLAAAGTFALVSQVVGGTFDFGLYMPANALLMALICGSLCGQDAATRGKRTAAELGPEVPGDRFNGLIVYLTLLVGILPVIWEFYHLARIEPLIQRSVMLRVMDAGDGAQLQESTTKLASRRRFRSDDADANHAVSILWMEQFRWRLYEQFRGAQPWRDVDELWENTEPLTLLVAFHRLRQSGADASQLLQQIQAAGPMIDAALAYNQRALRHCPWDARYQLWQAKLQQLKGETSSTRALTARAERFAGGNPALWLQSGTLQFLAGDTEGAESAWARASELAPQMRHEYQNWRKLLESR